MIHSYALYLSQGGEETEQIDQALARAYLNLGDYENAKRFVNHLIAQHPDDLALLRQVIPLALEADKPEEAAEYLKKLEIAAPRDTVTKTLKERVSAGLGERRLARLAGLRLQAIQPRVAGGADGGRRGMRRVRRAREGGQHVGKWSGWLQTRS
jgi:tetratricopeptide (TPR) repeat protein